MRNDVTTRSHTWREDLRWGLVVPEASCDFVRFQSCQSFLAKAPWRHQTEADSVTATHRGEPASAWRALPRDCELNRTSGRSRGAGRYLLKHSTTRNRGRHCRKWRHSPTTDMMMSTSEQLISVMKGRTSSMINIFSRLSRSRSMQARTFTLV